MAKSPSKSSDATEGQKVLPQESENPTVPKPTDDLDGPALPSTAPKVQPPKSVDWWDALRSGDDEAFTKDVQKSLDEIIAKHSSLANYEVLFLFDNDSIGTFHSDRLYSAASALKGKSKDILLVVNSPGGRVEPAYLISKTLKRIAHKTFSVAVPRRAKSAATLLALGADEIHMGMMSQLGPIDPQFSGLPVLGLSNGLNHIADLACKFPNASDMLTKYLIDQAPIRILGYYERVGESAAQYAERLLTGKTLPAGTDAAHVAKHLVHHYKDHAFVIDTEEALSLLGPQLIREQTPEYTLADELYVFLELVQLLVSARGKNFWVVGSPVDGITIRKKPAE
jgi:Serine dehydrogenase proteinase